MARNSKGEGWDRQRPGDARHRPAARRQLELWGGVECTVNRVGDEYCDQLERNGHVARTEDLDLFARLGITALRYPVLWERQRVTITTRLFLWGCGKPLAVLLRNEFEESEEARRLAAARGWDAARPGAWAREIGLPLPLSEAIEALASTLGSDSAVAGWDGREVPPPELDGLRHPLPSPSSE